MRHPPSPGLPHRRAAFEVYLHKMVHTLVCWNSQCLRIDSLALPAPAEWQQGLQVQEACIFEGLEDKGGSSSIAGFVYLGKRKISLSVPLLKHMIKKNENRSYGRWIAIILPILYPPYIHALYKVALQLFPSKAGVCFPRSWIGAGLMTCFGQYTMPHKWRSVVPRQGLARHGSHLPSLPTMWTMWAWWKPTSRKALFFWGHSRSTCSQSTPKPLREPSKISRATCPSHRWPHMHA